METVEIPLEEYLKLRDFYDRRAEKNKQAFARYYEKNRDSVLKRTGYRQRLSYWANKFGGTENIPDDIMQTRILRNFSDCD